MTSLREKERDAIIIGKWLAAVGHIIWAAPHRMTMIIASL